MNRQEIRQFIHEHTKNWSFVKSIKEFEWNSMQGIFFYVVFCIFFEVILFSCVFGSKISIIAVLYIIYSLIVLGIAQFVYKLTNYKNISKRVSKRISFKIIILSQLFALFLLSWCICNQPFYKFKVTRQIEKAYVIHLEEQNEIQQQLSPSIPWNCFTPEIQTNLSIPVGLSFVVSQSVIDEQVALLVGKPEKDSGNLDVKVMLKCNGLISLDYPMISFKTCFAETNENICHQNGCGYCKTTTQEFCGICGYHFVQKCSNSSGISFC